MKNAFMRKNLIIIVAVAALLSGCATSKSISAADFNPFYVNLADNSETFIKSLQDTDNQEFLEAAKEDYKNKARNLEKVSYHFVNLAKNLKPETAESFETAGQFILDLSKDFLDESKYLQTLIPNCPLAWDDSKRQEIEDCGRANLRWGSSATRAMACTYYFASLEFENIPEFDTKKVTLFSDYSYSEKDLKSCELFKNSNTLYGYPAKVGTTWIPERFQTKFLKADQMFVVEISENLYTASEADLFTDALYGSWNGSCSVYAKYESLLREGGYLLGSIKNGTCF
jgi:hypothetical protein